MRNRCPRCQRKVSVFQDVSLHVRSEETRPWFAWERPAIAAARIWYLLVGPWYWLLVLMGRKPTAHPRHGLLTWRCRCGATLRNAVGTGAFRWYDALVPSALLVAAILSDHPAFSRRASSLLVSLGWLAAAVAGLAVWFSCVWAIRARIEEVTKEVKE